MVGLALALVALWPAPSAMAAGEPAFGCGHIHTAEAQRNPYGPNDGPPPIAIGDSTMLLPIPDLTRVGFDVNAKGCRGFKQSVWVARDLRNRGVLPRLILINAYGNGGVNDDLIKFALKVIGPKRTLVLVTAYNADTGEAPAPDTDVLVKAAKDHPDQIKLLDWVKYSLPHHKVEPGPGCLVPPRPLSPELHRRTRSTRTSWRRCCPGAPRAPPRRSRAAAEARPGGRSRSGGAALILAALFLVRRRVQIVTVQRISLRLVPAVAVLAIALACSPAALARGGAGHNDPTKKLEDAFKIALYVRSVSSDGCYPPAQSLAKKIAQTKRGLKVRVANGLGGVNRFNIVFVLKHGSNCNKVMMALRGSSGLYVLNSAQGTIRIHGRGGPRVVPGKPGPPRSVRLVSKQFKMSAPDQLTRLEVLCPGGRYPIGGGMTVNLPPGPDGEGIYPHSYERLGAQLGFHISEVLYDASPSLDHSAQHHRPGGLRPWPDPPEPHAAQDRVHAARSDEVSDRPLPEGPAADHRRLPAHQLRERRRQLHHRVSGRRNECLEGDGQRLHRQRHDRRRRAHRDRLLRQEQEADSHEVASTPAPVAQGANASATTPDCPGDLQLTSTGFALDSRNAFYAGSSINDDGTTTANAFNFSVRKLPRTVIVSRAKYTVIPGPPAVLRAAARSINPWTRTIRPSCRSKDDRRVDLELHAVPPPRCIRGGYDHAVARIDEVLRSIRRSSRSPSYRLVVGWISLSLARWSSRPHRPWHGSPDSRIGQVRCPVRIRVLPASANSRAISRIFIAAPGLERLRVV